MEGIVQVCWQIGCIEF